MINFIVENYQNTDFPHVEALWKSVGMGLNTQDELAGIIRHGGQVLLAWSEQPRELIGTTLWAFDGERAIVRRMAVHPDYRRCGIASSLLERAQDQIKAAGIGKAVLWTESSNAEAQALYAKMGWTARLHNLELWQTAL
jgi:ribosomal protein S18 acetylase RimI-like enzyme